MNRFFAAAILAAGALLSIPMTSFAAPAGPAVVVEKPVLDVGEVARGEMIDVSFVISNQGDQPLQISEVAPTCGCTVADYDKIIAPNSEGKIHAVVDTASILGPNAKTIKVFTNDPKRPELALSIRSDVKPYLFALPGYARYTTFIRNERDQVEGQTVWAEDFDDLQVLGVEAESPNLRATFRELKAEEHHSDGSGRQWRVEITLRKEAPVGPIAERVVVRTNHPKQPQLEVPVSGFIRPLVAVSPASLDFGTVDLGNPNKRGFMIRSFASKALQLGDTEITVPGFDVEVTAIEEGKRYQVVLTPIEGLAPGAFSGKVKIPTNLEKQRLLLVDITGKVK